MSLTAYNTYRRLLHNEHFHTLCPLPSPEGQVGIGILFFLPLPATSGMKGFLGHSKPGKPSTQSANTPRRALSNGWCCLLSSKINAFQLGQSQHSEVLHRISRNGSRDYEATASTSTRKRVLSKQSPGTCDKRAGVVCSGAT